MPRYTSKTPTTHHPWHIAQSEAAVGHWTSNQDVAMLWEACTLGFFIFFCAVENWLLPFNSLLQISFNSLPWHSPWLSSFFINSSGETVELKLTELVRGWISWTATVLYPVSAILHYLAVCPANDLATLLSPPSYPMAWLMASPMVSTSHCCLYVEW